MKRVLFTALALAGLTLADAQQKKVFSETLTLKNKQKKKLDQIKPDFEFNRAELFQQIPADFRSLAGRNTAKTTVTPFASIQSQLWGQVTNAANGEMQTFQIDYRFDQDAAVDVKLLDNDFAVTKSFSVPLPETANSFSLLREYFVSADGKKHFMIYVHYFAGTVSPENQRNEIYVVDETGDIVKKFEARSAQVAISGDVKRLLTFTDTDENVEIRSHNLSDLSLKKQLDIPAELFDFYAGDPVVFVDVKGQPSMIITHYKKLFMDNGTLEVFPDNNLMLGIYDFDLNKKKEVALDISTNYPDEQFTIPMADFGNFYRFGKYEVTDNVFDPNPELEFLYSISYYDMLGDSSWNHYYVANEEGQRILSLEETIVGTQYLKELPGHEDQVSLLIGGEEGIDALQMFDIKSWKPAFSFPAYYNDELLSLYFNRTAVGGSYHYLFGMPSGEMDGDTAYAKINEYKADGNLDQTIRLPLGQDVVNFIPLLSDESLDNNLLTDDNDRKYMYVSQHMKDGNGYNVLRIAKGEKDVIFEARGDGEKGNVTSSGFFTATGAPTMLALMYTTDNNMYTTDIYKLPLTTGTMATVDAAHANNDLQVYTAYDTVNWNRNAVSFVIYNMAGGVVKQGNAKNSTSIAGLNKGVYLISITTAKGERLTKRFIVR